MDICASTLWTAVFLGQVFNTRLANGISALQYYYNHYKYFCIVCKWYATLRKPNNNGFIFFKNRQLGVSLNKQSSETIPVLNQCYPILRMPFSTPYYSRRILGF